MPSLVHATARLCQAAPSSALAHLSTRAGMSRVTAEYRKRDDGKLNGL